MWVRRSDFHIDGNLKGFDFTHSLSRVKAPSLVVIGDRDLVSTATADISRASLPRATLVVMAECAHMMFIDQTARFNRLLEEFLNLCTTRPRPPCMNGNGPGMFFAAEEYRSRWERVYQAMAARGYEHLLIWQRGAGTFDRVGDVLWLTNFVMNGSGQDPASEEIAAPYTFSAVLMRRGREPELHVGLPAEDLDLSRVVCGEVISHPENLMTGLAAYLREQGIAGRIAVVGDDVLPGMYDRLLRRHTPQIEWHADETLLLGPQSIKSAPRARGVPHGRGHGHPRAHSGLRVLVDRAFECRGGLRGGGHPAA